MRVATPRGRLCGELYAALCGKAQRYPKKLAEGFYLIENKRVSKLSVCANSLIPLNFPGKSMRINDLRMGHRVGGVRILPPD